LITDLSAAEEQGLKVTLAADKVYQSTQIPKVGGLEDIQFEISKQADGNYKVVLSGKQAIPQRHADLIIELEWASGRRYINLGVDFDESATPTSESGQDKPSAPVADKPGAEPAPAQATASEPAAPSEPVPEKPAAAAQTAPETASTDKPSSVATPTPPESAASTEAANNSLEVKKGDTASKLLLTHPVEGVSLDQVLLAMLHMNPHAFVNDNVNRLAAGALVILPNADEAGTYDAKHARESIRLQATDFKAYRASLAAKVPVAKQANISKRESSGNLKADVTASAKAPDDQLSLSKPGDSEADKLSKQLQEEDTAKQVKEVQANLSQLGQLSQAMTRFKEGLAAKFPMLSATYEQSMVWIKRHVFELIGGFALLVALIVSYSVMRERRREEEPHLSTDDNPHDSANHAYAHEMSLPPELNLNLDLDTAPEPSPTPLPPQAIKADAPPVRQSVIDPGEDPFLMRLELADELWKLGQKQTALALAQEVADQTHGETRDMAQRWLKDHT
jgi:FimV-like protein